MRVTRPRVAAVIWAVPLFVFLAVWLASFWLTAREHHIALGSAFVGIEDGRMSFFNDDAYGPYRGSVVFLTGADDKLPPGCEFSGFDFPGVYYRYIRLPDGALWTLTTSLFFPIALSAAAPILWIISRMRRSGSVGRGPLQSTDT
jgi:hypothetical protein